MSDTRKKSMTIRETERMRLNNVNSTKKEMNKWGIYRYPTPTKKIKSVSLLRKKLQEFFEESNSDPKKAEMMITPTQLAIYLGYSSANAMYRDINNPDVAPEYAQLLDRAVDLIKDNLQRRQLRYAEFMNDWKGVDAVLQRIDKAQEKTEPVEDEEKNINININLEKQERIKGLVDERIASLMANAIDVEEVEEGVSGSEVELLPC